MPRYCSACGRSLDADGHDRDEPESVTVPTRRGRGRIGLRRQRLWACRVRLIATGRDGASTLVPHTPQRFAPSLARYVHTSRFQGDLTP